ncbi:MAG: hypothetical protein CO035_03240 [Candidatus Omnitrophica bacterium CG_4_9_14_0_2_um_filter_42_8]|nr:MAG: hypothetical protein COW92_00350 [Candidatus Omnitrophica bacterium CG22_combo_CG10-13_8_21_14_all_43_16]PJC48481.1 MAG: hypothetical protein CO035_03240 [Candidatus Omnitrophica bacterium CG_4_9_14_0_2_um_filter_42_8]
MNEQEFWAYCDELRKYPGNYADGDRLPREIVIQMGELLLQKRVSPRAQTTIMMTLAHQWRSKEALKYLKAYNQMQDDEGMRIFTQFAIEECRW